LRVGSALPNQIDDWAWLSYQRTGPARCTVRLHRHYGAGPLLADSRNSSRPKLCKLQLPKRFDRRKLSLTDRSPFAVLTVVKRPVFALRRSWHRSSYRNRSRYEVSHERLPLAGAHRPTARGWCGYRRKRTSDYLSKYPPMALSLPALPNGYFGNPVSSFGAAALSKVARKRKKAPTKRCGA
jgi:hypothetical protein